MLMSSELICEVGWGALQIPCFLDKINNLIFKPADIFGSQKDACFINVLLIFSFSCSDLDYRHGIFVDIYQTCKKVFHSI